MVYVVDDGADYRFLLQEVFNRFLPQYPVRFFADGNELKQHVLAQGSERPRVILLDLDMPVLNGYKTLLFLKQESGWHQIPVIIMTSSMSARDISACYDLGASSFLTKPSGFEQMQHYSETICRYWLELNQVPKLA